MCCIDWVQFKMWSTADDSIICRFTADAKDKPHPGEYTQSVDWICLNYLVMYAICLCRKASVGRTGDKFLKVLWLVLFSFPAAFSFKNLLDFSKTTTMTLFCVVAFTWSRSTNVSHVVNLNLRRSRSWQSLSLTHIVLELFAVLSVFKGPIYDDDWLSTAAMVACGC